METFVIRWLNDNGFLIRLSEPFEAVDQTEAERIAVARAHEHPYGFASGRRRVVPIQD